MSKEKPARKLVSITPADGTTLSPMPRALWVGGAGDVAVIAADDTAAVTIVGVPAGSWVPIECKEVRATNTTATSIVGLI